jgi:uroporphyrinogen-III synthase
VPGEGFAAPLQEVTLGRVLGERDGRLVRQRRLTVAAKAAEQVGPAGVEQVVAVQVAGGGSPRLLEELTAAGVEALTVRPYRWKVPDDRGGTHRLIDELLDGQVDVMVFTSPPAVNGLFEVAADLGRADAVWAALTDGTAVAVIGPATAEAVEARRLPVSICPLQPRSDALLHALAAWRSLPQLRPAITVDAGARHVAVERSELPLSDLEFALVASLARRAGVTCTTPVLLREVWGEAGDRRRLEVLVSRVRPRLAALGLSIESVPKRGYRLASEDG